MTSPEERSLAHAKAVRARGAALPPEGLPPPEILDSWVRCSAAGLDLAAPQPIRVVDAAQLARRRDRAAHVRRLALAEIETLCQQIAGSNFLLAFADPDGIVLDLYADNRFLTSGSATDIVAGSDWTESRCGTNGLGTALATGRSVAVNGLEHYFFKYGDISCTAAPIRDAHGEIVGALDASSYFESRQRHTQALVQMACAHVENLLLQQQMRGHVVIAIHPRAEFLGTLSAGLLAFDGDGCVSALNDRARNILAGLEPARGTRFERLFDAPFERFAARLHEGAELRLRDTMGSALVASCVSAPARAALHLPARGVVHAPAPMHEAAPATPMHDAPRTAPLPAVGPADFVAHDPAVAEALRTLRGALRLRAPVLITGETGTGKELLARHAHRESGRRGEFVAVNCAAIPAELFEAELFGHAPGAFTGARRDGHVGLITSADGGTLLLDEIGELPLPLQAALLRLLDDWQVRPLGATRARRVDVQLLAATHVDLAAQVAAGRFRADLMHRLDTVRIELPPLRRRSDFAEIVRHVLAGIDAEASIDDAAIAELSQHRWDGNMRELRTVLTRALLPRADHRVGPSPGRPKTDGAPRGQERSDWGADIDAAGVRHVLPATTTAPALQSALARGALERVLQEYERTGRCVSQTSRNLGISRTTVYRYLREGAAATRRDPLN